MIDCADGGALRQIDAIYAQPVSTSQRWAPNF